ncbi:hypothetical protein EON83_29885 [bacterium]|nr:MAG: hypothetical protein EON83_29885 [bacterium]
MIDIAVCAGVVLGAIAGAALYAAYVVMVEKWFFGAKPAFPTGSILPGGLIGAAVVLMGVGIWRRQVYCRGLAVTLVVLPCLLSLYALTEVLSTDRVFLLCSVLGILPVVVTPIFVVLLPRLVQGYRASRESVTEE